MAPDLVVGTSGVTLEGVSLQEVLRSRQPEAISDIDNPLKRSMLLFYLIVIHLRITV